MINNERTDKLRKIAIGGLERHFSDKLLHFLVQIYDIRFQFNVLYSQADVYIHFVPGRALICGRLIFKIRRNTYNAKTNWG